jgi:hypothetical protein
MKETFYDTQAKASPARPMTEIERLWLDGNSTYAIADQLRLQPRIIGRALREIRKRYTKKCELDQLARYELIYHEAIAAWRRSQDPKTVTTREAKDGQEFSKKTLREEQGPGQNAFLLTAIRAMREQRAINLAPEQQRGPKPPTDLLTILESLTDEQMRKMSDEELALLRREVDILRGREEKRAAEPARFHDVHQARLPGQLAPQSAGEDAGPGSGRPVPAADGLPAAAAWQERIGEPPLAGLAAGQGPGPAADRREPHP